jgi:hypothetical protein
LTDLIGFVTLYKPTLKKEGMKMYFEKTLNKKTLNGIELTQIRYLKDIPQFDVKAGQLGGWVSEKANLEQNGKWFLGTETNVFGGNFYGGNFKGGYFEGGYFEGGTFEGGTFSGGTFYGGYFFGGTFKGGNFYGGNFYGGNFYGGTFEGGKYDLGDFPSGFGKVSFIEGGRFPLNFSGYTSEGERVFACGCQVFPESKWTLKFRKELAQKHNFTDLELILSEKLFDVLKEMTPTKTKEIPVVSKSGPQRDKFGRFVKKT